MNIRTLFSNRITRLLIVAKYLFVSCTMNNLVQRIHIKNIIVVDKDLFKLKKIPTTNQPFFE